MTKENALAILSWYFRISILLNILSLFIVPVGLLVLSVGNYTPETFQSILAIPDDVSFGTWRYILLAVLFLVKVLLLTYIYKRALVIVENFQKKIYFVPENGVPLSEISKALFAFALVNNPLVESLTTGIQRSLIVSAWDSVAIALSLFVIATVIKKESNRDDSAA